jgi:peptide/nickel transport system ATP-binding protein
MTDSKTGPLLVVDGLRIEGDSSGEWREIVKGVSFTLGRGEVIGLIGESGAGKSTIGLAALGYARPGCRFSGGHVLYDGEDLLTMSGGALKALRGIKMSYVAQ